MRITKPGLVMRCLVRRREGIRVRVAFKVPSKTALLMMELSLALGLRVEPRVVLMVMMQGEGMCCYELLLVKMMVCWAVKGNE